VSKPATEPPADHATPPPTPPAATPPAPAPAPTAAPAAPPAAPRVQAESIASARSNITPTRVGDQPVTRADDPDADAHPDDPDADDNGIDGAELLQRELGATVIDEIPHE
jgi:DNA polymerase-3 subunit gamma/tau